MSALPVLKRDGTQRPIDDESLQFDQNGLSIGDDDLSENKGRYQASLPSPKRIKNKKLNLFKQQDEVKSNSIKVKNKKMKN